MKSVCAYCRLIKNINPTNKYIYEVCVCAYCSETWQFVVFERLLGSAMQTPDGGVHVFAGHGRTQKNIREMCAHLGAEACYNKITINRGTSACVSHEKVSTPFTPFKWWFVVSEKK